MATRSRLLCMALGLALLLGCARTDVIESHRTGYVPPDTGLAPRPKIVWTSRNMDQEFDYLGLVRSRSWSYDAALNRLVEGARELRADAIVDIHFERIGFFKTMHAFAIKYR